MPHNFFGYAAAALQAAIIGFSFLFVSVALRSAPPLDLLAWRFLIAFFVASIPVIAGVWRPRLSVIDVARIAPLAILYPVFFFLFQTWGLVHIPTSEAGIIQAFSPVLTLILATMFLGERTSRLQQGFILLSVSGVVLISLLRDGWETSGLLGTGLMGVSTLSIAVYTVLTRSASRRYSVATLTYVLSATACAAFVTASIVGHLRDGSLDMLLLPWQDRSFVVSILYLGVLSSLVTSFLAIFALSRLDASKVGVFGNLSVLVTVAAGVLLLGEPVSGSLVIGGSMIAIGVVGASYAGYRPTADKCPR